MVSIPGIWIGWRRQSAVDMLSCENTAAKRLVSSPDQIFCARPADSSKNRVWTLSLRKLGQVYIWRSVNWVIVGVNYIISNQQRLLWHQKICKLAIYDDAQRNLLYLTNLIGATTWHYARTITPQFYQWRCPDPIFRQGHRARVKNLVSGYETTKRRAFATQLMSLRMASC